jgi:cytochrome c553
MNPAVRRSLLWTAGTAFGLALIFFAVVFGISEWRMRRPYEALLVPLRAVLTADPVAGEHWARLVGCWSGCHGDRGEGGTESIEGIVTHAAPTLSQVLPQYSDAELLRLIRYGVKRDGRSAVGMTSYTFWALGDQDIANIVAHLRRQPATAPVPRHLDLTLRGRIALVTGEWKVSAEQVDRTIPRWGELPRRTPYERGRYLASVICSECHGLDFEGIALEGAPSLVVLAAYDLDQFRSFIRTNRALGGRRIPPMGWTPEVGFTDAEIDDLYAFLRTYHGLDPAASRDGLR